MERLGEIASNSGINIDLLSISAVLSSLTGTAKAKNNNEIIEGLLCTSLAALLCSCGTLQRDVGNTFQLMSRQARLYGGFSPSCAVDTGDPSDFALECLSTLERSSERYRLHRECLSRLLSASPALPDLSRIVASFSGLPTGSASFTHDGDAASTLRSLVAAGRLSEALDLAERLLLQTQHERLRADPDRSTNCPAEIIATLLNTVSSFKGLTTSIFFVGRVKNEIVQNFQQLLMIGN
jgi:hypothetical protein